jgi:hypothetical protein
MAAPDCIERVPILSALNPKSSLPLPNLHANQSYTRRNPCAIMYVLLLMWTVLIGVSLFAPGTVMYMHCVSDASIIAGQSMGSPVLW